MAFRQHVHILVARLTVLVRRLHQRIIQLGSNCRRVRCPCVRVTGERTVRAGAIGRPPTSAAGCFTQTDFVVAGRHNFELVTLEVSNVVHYWRAKPVLQISLVRRVG
jgi:hypothetical protein